jgi:hypothetical protein
MQSSTQKDGLCEPLCRLHELLFKCSGCVVLWQVLITALWQVHITVLQHLQHTLHIDVAAAACQY